MRGRETEHGIQNAILDFLAAHRIFAFRLNTARFRIMGANGKERFFNAHSLGAGAADILALPFPYGTPLWIEVKGPGGEQSAEQASFAANVRAHGHRYILARSVEDVMTEVTQ